MKRVAVFLIALIAVAAAHAAPLSANERRIAEQQIADFEASRARLEQLENAQRQFEELGLEAGAIRRAADKIQGLAEGFKDAANRLADAAGERAAEARDAFIQGAKDQLLDQALGAAGEIKIVGDILDAKDKIDQADAILQGDLGDLLPFIGFFEFVGDAGQALGQALRDRAKLEELGRQAADAAVRAGKLREEAFDRQERADAFKAQVDAARDELARLRELRERAEFARLLLEGDKAQVSGVPVTDTGGDPLGDGVGTGLEDTQVPLGSGLPDVVGPPNQPYQDATTIGTNAIGGGTLTPDQMRIASMPSPTQMPAPTPPPMDVAPPAPTPPPTTPPAPTPPPVMTPPMDPGMTPFFTGTGQLLLLGTPAMGQIPLIDPVMGTLTMTIGAVTAGAKTNVIASSGRQAPNFPFTSASGSTVTIEAFGPGTPVPMGMGTLIPVTTLKIGNDLITANAPDLFFPTN